jgi:hypothetical protein
MYFSSLKYKWLHLLGFVLVSVVCCEAMFAQDATIKLMAYNVHEYWEDHSSLYTPARLTAIRSVINPINPDIFIGIEIRDNSTTADLFRTEILNDAVTGEYTLGSPQSTTNADGDYSNFVYYRTGDFTFNGSTIVVDDGKWPTLKYELYHISTGNTIVIFGAHMTSGGGGDAQRLSEATAIRTITDTYSSNVYFIAAGDFNLVSSSSETAYSNLLNQSSTGYFLDPGDFTASNRTFSTPNIPNRYDLILNSQSVVSGSYVVYKSGTFDVIGNTGGTTGTPYTTASDHLPVYAEYDLYDNPTPVELSHFTGSIYGNNVELHWRTETEVNNYGFYIERATDNSDWKVIGFVEGHGNSNSPKLYNYTDSDINQSDSYLYRLKQVDNNGTFEYSNVVTVNVDIPNVFYLSQNYPNPFNPETRIDYTLPGKQLVTLRIYNMLGNLVSELVNDVKEAGSYSEFFNASNFPSGVYIYRLQASEFTDNKKLTFIK